MELCSLDPSGKGALKLWFLPGLSYERSRSQCVLPFTDKTLDQSIQSIFSTPWLQNGISTKIQLIVQVDCWKFNWKSGVVAKAGGLHFQILGCNFRTQKSEDSYFCHRIYSCRKSTPAGQGLGAEDSYFAFLSLKLCSDESQEENTLKSFKKEHKNLLMLYCVSFAVWCPLSISSSFGTWPIMDT